MERHTYFLPRYDDGGRMANEGHALATEAGIPHLLRRTYRHPASPAGDGDYDFLTYFECDDAHVATFHQVCAALRDLKRNPEWRPRGSDVAGLAGRLGQRAARRLPRLRTAGGGAGEGRYPPLGVTGTQGSAQVGTLG